MRSKLVWRSFVALALVLCLTTLALSGCGKKFAIRFIHASGGSAGATAAGNAPAGVDPSVYAKLKAELERQLAARTLRGDKIVAAAPLGDAGKVTDFTYDPVRHVLRWTYVNRGDYDFSHEVGVSDITPIAINYLHLTDDGIGDDVLETWVDGSGNGEVGVEDITPLAMNYMSFVNEYVILAGDSDAGPFNEVGRATFDNALPGTPIIFEITWTPSAHHFMAVEPVDTADVPGAMSNVIDVLNIVHGDLEIVETSIYGAAIVDTEITRPITIRNNTDAPIDWTLSHDRPWMLFDLESGTAGPRSDTPVTVTLSAAGLSLGSYNGRATLSYATGSDVCFAGFSVQDNGPIVNVIEQSLTFTAQEGGQDVQVLTIQNDGTLDLDWTVSSDAPWLTFLPDTTGTITPGNQSPVDVTASAVGMTAGTYNAVITVIETGNAANSDTCSVQFTVTPGATQLLDHLTADNAVSGAGTQADPWVFPVGTNRVQVRAWTAANVEITSDPLMVFGFGSADPPGPSTDWSGTQVGYLIWGSFDSVVEVTGQQNGLPNPPMSYWIYKAPF